MTLFPEIFSSALDAGVIGRAFSNRLASFSCWNPRDWATDVHRTVDDRPYGGGPGMLMKVEPLQQAIQAARLADPTPATVVMLSPQGKLMTQDVVQELAANERLILVCGRYEGVDERLIELEVDKELSIGDYVISGGEFAALVMIDAVLRLCPGVLGHPVSAAQDSFMDGLLDCPHYTRPESYQGLDVPKVLLAGHHAQTAVWRRQQALKRTLERRPELIDRATLDKNDKDWLATLKKRLDNEQ